MTIIQPVLFLLRKPVAFALMVAGAAWAHAQQPLTIVVDEYPPYIDSTKQNHGFLSEITSKAFARSGYIVDYVYMPWKRIGQVEIDKKNRMSIGYIHTPERTEKWLFSDSIVVANTAFVVLKSTTFSWQTMEDLKRYKMGLSQGYSYGVDFDAIKHEMDVEYAATDTMNIKKVLRNRIQIFPVDPYVGAEIIRNLNKQDSQFLTMVHEPNLSSDSMHAVCSKHSYQCHVLLKKFNEGLKQLKADGTFQQIIDRAISLSAE